MGSFLCLFFLIKSCNFILFFLLSLLAPWDWSLIILTQDWLLDIRAPLVALLFVNARLVAWYTRAIGCAPFCNKNSTVICVWECIALICDRLVRWQVSMLPFVAARVWVTESYSKLHSLNHTISKTDQCLFVNDHFRWWMSLPRFPPLQVLCVVNIPKMSRNCFVGIVSDGGKVERDDKWRNNNVNLRTINW